MYQALVLLSCCCLLGLSMGGTVGARHCMCVPCQRMPVQLPGTWHSPLPHLTAIALCSFPHHLPFLLLPDSGIFKLMSPKHHVALMWTGIFSKPTCRDHVTITLSSLCPFCEPCSVVPLQCPLLLQAGTGQTSRFLLAATFIYKHRLATWWRVDVS